MEDPQKVKKVTLFDSKSERINTNVIAFFEKDGSLRIDGCDSGPLVKKMWDDFDYEYIITVKSADLPKLESKLKTTPNKLLEVIAKKFNGERAFSNFKSFVESHDIPFDFFTWA